ncbi:MAG: hypothetical protein PHZ06_12280 [Proteiniphilum sp.]|jgi:hypothetical protein|nr:hypothetical protein [Proteiniphilum sp.]
MFNLKDFKKSLKKAFKKIESTQTEALNIELTKNYLAGRTAGEKHRSTLPLKSADQEELTENEKEELALLLALFLGNLKKFNTSAQDQILNKVKEMSEAGSTQDEIQKYVSDVFSGKENITIDNVGKKKKELYVDKDLQISERSKIISKPFSASTLVYSSLLADIAAHRAYEEGRKQALIQGNKRWVFVGPVDEVARPWHVSLVGQIYTWGTLQSDYAEKVLREPHCRHRAQEYSEKDYDAKYWQRLKDEAGLFWDGQEQAWKMKINEV